MAILNLDQRFPIVDPKTGQPTDYFMRMLRGVTGPTGQAQTDIATLFARNLMAGSGLTGGGDLTADRTFAIDMIAEAERIRDVIGSALVAGSNVTITVNDGADTITIAATGGGGGSAYEASPTTVPNLSGFATWRNQGTATATADSFGVYLGGDNDSELHIREMNLPATPFSYYARIRGKMNTTTALTTGIQMDMGFCLVNSTSGRVLTAGISNYRSIAAGDEMNNFRGVVWRWASVTSFNTSVAEVHDIREFHWIRLDVTATGATLYIGVDGRRWIQVGSTESFASYLTATGGSADKFGIFIRTGQMNASDPTFAYFDVLQSTAP